MFEYYGLGIGDRNAEAGGLHDRQIWFIVTDAGHGFGWNTELRRNLGECFALGFLTEPDMLDAQFDHAYFNRRAVPAGDHCDLDPGPHDLLDAMTVVNVKDFGLTALRIVVQLTIGHDAIDVEHEQTDGCESSAEGVRGLLIMPRPGYMTPARSRSCTFRAPTSMF